MIDDVQKKTVAASAVTAAAVALVTIVVYEGSVKVTDSGKTTAVAAGTTYQIKGPSTVIEEDALNVGGGPLKTAEIGVQPLDRSTVRTSLDKQEIQRVMTRLAQKLRGCAMDVGFDGRITATVTVSPEGTVDDVKLAPADAPPAECIKGILASAKFTKTKSITIFEYPFVFSNMSAKSTCDFDALFARGQEAFSTSAWSEALVAYDAAYKCRPDAQALQLVFAAACRAKNVPKAKLYWAKLNQSRRDQLATLCVAAGITVETLDQHQ
jgi:hypothetical protein